MAETTVRAATPGILGVIGGRFILLNKLLAFAINPINPPEFKLATYPYFGFLLSFWGTYREDDKKVASFF